MSDGETIKADEVGKVSDIIPPGQAVASSRTLDPLVEKSLKTIHQLRRGSLAAKVAALSVDMSDFNRESHEHLDVLAEKIALARAKRDQALAIQHAYYDAHIGDFQDTTENSS